MIELTLIPGATPAYQTEGVRAAQSAAALLEWLTLVSPAKAADMAVRLLDATICENDEAAHITLHGMDAIDADLGNCLRLWCGTVLRSLGGLSGMDPLLTFLGAFAQKPAEKIHLVTIAAAQMGAGSWIDPTLPAQRVTSHFYEIDMFGIIGRGATALEAAENWRCAALADLPARILMHELSAAA
ncbi:hypothetical protein RSK20926_11649 [Roseobacter sp. SK209-2-6]|uniref:hypothetical protein n=1 Tax=Roseobacter sp. SK209-2-6 TaxID=388739 RepID=UPI0000F3C5C6|nr:hypothetical protein [Roseobacter sp. SK209-2-6]EBA18371.1 hypothetical protein RSK20926_11649 [Roseobacter sp. SK209-2-6]